MLKPLKRRDLAAGMDSSLAEGQIARPGLAVSLIEALVRAEGNYSLMSKSTTRFGALFLAESAACRTSR